jgi:hypothetical protein
MGIMFVAGLIGQFFSYKLLVYLKKNHVQRWAELVGAEFDGKKWNGGWRTGFDGPKYILGKKDDEYKEVHKLKQNARRCLLLVLIPMAIFIFNLFGVIVIWVINGCPGIH